MTWERVRLGKMTIGLVDVQAKVYRVTRKYPDDVARKHDAYGIDADTIMGMVGLGVDTVELEEHRGKGVRLYRMPIQDWVDGLEDHLGEKGLWHRFIPLRDLPDAQVLKAEPCGKRLGCCGTSCEEAVRHWQPKPARVDGEDPLSPTPHRCPRCGHPERA